MNDYIISPEFIYWIGRCDSIKIIMIIVAITSLVILFVWGSTYIIDLEYKDMLSSAENNCKKFKKALPILIVSLVISSIGSIFIPTKDELMKMYLCKYTTKTNAEKVLDVLDEKTDALIEAIGKGGK